MCAYDHVTIVHDDGKNICDHKCNEDRVKLIENEIMKNKADHEKEIKTLKDKMNLHKKSKDLENKITEVNNLYSRFDKLENLVKVMEKRIVDISEKKIEDLGNKLIKMKNDHQEEIKSIHTKIKGQEKAIEEKTSNSEKKSSRKES